MIGGQRPHLGVIVDLDTLIGGDGMRCELARTGTITAETARRILCDAEVTRILVDGDSVPLDMGRAVHTRHPGAAQGAGDPRPRLLLAGLPGDPRPGTAHEHTVKRR